MTTHRHNVVDSPLGPLTLVEADGALARLWMADQRHRDDRATDGDRDDTVLPAAVEQLAAYFAGDRTAFDLPLAVHGTPFQQKVWTGLRDIPYGQTWTYAELAGHIGQPGASRAVGLANGRNPVSVVVPCHRVIGAGGKLTGYGGGLERKRWLLDLERGALRL